MTRAHPTRRPTQAERTAAMKQRLIDAAISSLIENGYAHTTSVEVCRRAGVTRFFSAGESSGPRRTRA